MEYTELKPKAVFDYFREINNVPRPSKHEEKIIEYLQNFASKNKLECKTDDAGNVLITKPATAGMENLGTVVLQSHMDMVCEKTTESNIDFYNDPIETYIDGEWLKAKGTTLGADDGIGVAMAMAVLTSKEIKHGPIECLFTRDEETGLTGAFAIQPGFMSGKYLINLDSEDEGEIFVGCAGGANTTATLNCGDFTETDSQTMALKITIDNLRGGHSGDDINKHRANANKLLARFLYIIREKYGCCLISDFQGGNLHNAIPRHAEAVVAIPFKDRENIRIDFNIFSSEIEGEYPDEESVSFKMESVGENVQTMSQEKSDIIINTLQAIDNGVYEMSLDMPGLVETSSNLASVKLNGNELKIVTSQRSSILSQRKCMSNTVRAIFKLAGFEVTTSEGYPGWKPNPNSEILKTAINSYKKLFNKVPKVKAIHAGLECGLFSEKYPGIDMISFGPTLRGVHSPDEALLIPTVEKVWKHMVDILENIPE